MRFDTIKFTGRGFSFWFGVVFFLFVVFAFFVGFASSAVAVELDPIPVVASPDRLSAWSSVGDTGGYYYTGKDFYFEIVDNIVVGDHIEIFVRAKNKYNERLGFGVDGSVDVERFRFFGSLPVYLVDKTVKSRGLYELEAGEQIPVWGVRYDPQSVVYSEIENTIRASGAFVSDNIVDGKVGHTVTTVYSEANPESTVWDGHVDRGPVTENWTTIINGNGDSGNDGDTYNSLYRWQTSSSSGNYQDVQIGVIGFQDPDIPTGDTISSAVVQVAPAWKADPGSNTPTYHLLGITPSSTTAYTASDYQSRGSTVLSSTVSYSSMATSTYSDFTLNASGLSYLNKTSANWFAFGSNFDSGTPTWHSQAWSGVMIYNEDSGGSYVPRLVITHSAPDPVCGNGVIEGTEACDDNDTDNGDGCSSVCAIESGYNCTGEPSVCTAIPDSGGTGDTFMDLSVVDFFTLVFVGGLFGLFAWFVESVFSDIEKFLKERG